MKTTFATAVALLAASLVASASTAATPVHHGLVKG